MFFFIHTKIKTQVSCAFFFEILEKSQILGKNGNQNFLYKFLSIRAIYFIFANSQSPGIIRGGAHVEALLLGHLRVHLRVVAIRVVRFVRRGTVTVFL